MKTKTSISAAIVLLLLIGAGAALWLGRERSGPGGAPGPTPRVAAVVPGTPAPRAAAVTAAPPREPLPGQAGAIVEPSEGEGGVISGRVINEARGDGIANAELTFTSDGGALTVRTRDDGGFELAPPAPGRFVLSAVAAPGFLPYAPELLHSTVHVVLARGQAVRGITVFLSPALAYRGVVVDARDAPVAGARVRLVSAPSGEQLIDKPLGEWTTDRDGLFTFNAADDSVLEAVRGSQRGWAQLDRSVAISKRLTIKLADLAARDATITGVVIDGSGAPIADVLVRATPAWSRGAGTNDGPRPTVFATTGADGAFTLGGLDHTRYDLDADEEDHAPARLDGVVGGTHGVTITLDSGLLLAGEVVDSHGRPVPAYTLLVYRPQGISRALVVARSIVDPRARFSVRVPWGDYALVASARGLAPSATTRATAGDRDIKLVLNAGAILRGTVVATQDGKPVPYAHVRSEVGGNGGASTQPANVATVTRDDGTFELTGLAPGRISITISADGYHPKIEAGMTAVDGETLGPVTLALTRLADGEQPRVELVGIGVVLAPDGDALRVERVITGGGAEAAGIVVGDHVVELDGAPVAPLGVDGAIGKIRGVAGTTISVTLVRQDQPVLLVVERRKIQV